MTLAGREERACSVGQEVEQARERACELATAMVDSLVQAGLVAAGRGDVSPKIVMNPSLLMEGYFAATQPVADEVLKVKWYAINGTYMLFGFTLFMMWLAYFSLALNAIMAVTEYYLALTITGILMALFMNNGGGAWDNAKKYVETGAYGGKGSHAHQATVVGDTVGDPLKDTAGPSLHVLIKLLSTITLVFAPLFI